MPGCVCGVFCLQGDVTPTPSKENRQPGSGSASKAGNLMCKDRTNNHGKRISSLTMCYLIEFSEEKREKSKEPEEPVGLFWRVGRLVPHSAAAREQLHV